MVCFRNYTNEEIAMPNGEVLMPHAGPKTMKPVEDVVYVVPDDIYLKARSRRDVTSPRMMERK